MRPPLGVSKISSRELHFGHFSLMSASMPGERDGTTRSRRVKAIPDENCAEPRVFNYVI
jgi:hypothetical protein